jgi:hypothetical protein
MKMILFILVGVMLISFVQASTVGYKVYNETVELWNPHTDYKINESTGASWAQENNEEWAKNVFCIGYYNASDDWIKIKCSDDLSNFNTQLSTDNTTYANFTLWKDFSYGAYDLRLGMTYQVEDYDKWLRVIPYVKNIGIDIPFDLGFAWRTKDIDVGADGIVDRLTINGTKYNLNKSGERIFENMSEFIRNDYVKTTYYSFHQISGNKYMKTLWKE